MAKIRDTLTFETKQKIFGKCLKRLDFAEMGELRKLKLLKRKRKSGS